MSYVTYIPSSTWYIYLLLRKVDKIVWLFQLCCCYNILSVSVKLNVLMTGLIKFSSPILHLNINLKNMIAQAINSSRLLGYCSTVDQLIASPIFRVVNLFMYLHKYFIDSM